MYDGCEWVMKLKSFMSGEIWIGLTNIRRSDYEFTDCEGFEAAVLPLLSPVGLKPLTKNLAT